MMKNKLDLIYDHATSVTKPLVEEVAQHITHLEGRLAWAETALANANKLITHLETQLEIATRMK